MTLFQHQDEGAAWLAARGRGYLGDLPGLGKTRTVIRALQLADVRRPLIACPAIVRTHWRREFEALGYRGYPVIKSYDHLTRGGMTLMAHLMLRDKIDALVLDEAHYVKHDTSKRTQLLMGRDGYARRLETVFLASGTPMPKHPGELWTQLCYLAPAVLREHGLTTKADFVARFCVTRPRFVRGKLIEKVVGTQHVEELQAILGRVMLRRTLDDVGLDVPRLFWQVTKLDSDEIVGPGVERSRPHFAELVRRLDAGESLAELLTDPHVARYRRRVGELKAPAVAEMLLSQLADSDEKVVVFAHHRSVLHTLREMLGTFGVAYIDGDVPDSQRAAEIDRFQTDPRCRVFLGQNIACQTGITLTAARRVVLVEPDWTAVVNEQLGHRVARIGQTAERCVGQLVALAGTLDEAIVGQHHRELRISAEVFGQAGAA